MKRIIDPDTNFRVVGSRIRQDFAQPVPVGSYVALIFQVMDYTPDADGSALATLEQVNSAGQLSGWEVDCIGLDSDDTVLLDSPDELHDML